MNWYNQYKILPSKPIRELTKTTNIYAENERSNKRAVLCQKVYIQLP